MVLLHIMVVILMRVCLVVLDSSHGLPRLLMGL